MKYTYQLFLVANIAAVLVDFAVNSVYEPSVCSTIFDTVITDMVKIVTLLLQFFAWFFMLSTRKVVQISGFESVFKDFFILFITTILDFVFFVVYAVILFIHVADGETIVHLWNNYLVITFYSIQRLFAVIHYAFCMYYMIKVSLDPKQYL